MPREVSRAEHLAWCKQRALQYVDAGNLQEAYTSFVSDLTKHEATKSHTAIMLGMMQMMGGHLSTPQLMREYIEGTN